MWKCWISSILGTISILALTSFLEVSYARTTPYHPLPALPAWEDMPEVAEILSSSFYASSSSLDGAALEANKITNVEDSASESLHYPLPPIASDGELPQNKSMYFKLPTSEKVSYNPKTNQYTVDSKIGDLIVGSRSMTFEEYLQYDLEKSMKSYWKTKAAYTPTASSGLNSLIPGLNINMDFLDNIFGKDFIKFDLNGSIELTFGLVGTRRDDPALDIKHRKTLNFDFDSKIDINLNAKIGDRIDFNISHNTEALFQFDNKLKLQYEGKEDEIIKSIEAGNINFPLNTTLIQGVQELFGVKAKLQFGNTFITGVFSEQRSENSNITVESGSQSTKYEFSADAYDENRHYFLAHYFRDHYHETLADLPLINTAVNITKVEVWVTNVGSPVDNNRNIVAFTDLAESHPWASNVRGNPNSIYPDQKASNNLFGMVNVNSLRNINTVSQYLSSLGYTGGREFEKVESARRLNNTEYTLNPRLGFVTLNQPLNSDQVLAVAYQYQIIGDSSVYQVGEFSDIGINDPQSLVVKLLKATTLNTDSPLWNLMMKNVYSLQSYQISPDNFRLNIMYSGDEMGVPNGYFSQGPRSGRPLIQVFGVDNLDAQGNRNPDGVFDFLDGASTGAGYIQADKGLIYMPYVEPFGKDMVAMFGGDSVASKPYQFNELYRKTKTEAQQFMDKNKYSFVGTYQASNGSEISLGVYNLPEGSVKVMAGNTPLIENEDYTVNYTAGIVQIINQGVLNSGVPINISTENSNSGGLLTKRMMGLRVEHFFTPDFYIGGTLMNLHQSVLTDKVNYGEEPVSNTIYGFDMAYNRESRWLTKVVDAILPFESSKTPSRISLYGEFAHFLPGHSRAIGKSGVTYIDDFEGSKTTINLKESYSWYLASTPQYQLDLFPESRDEFSSTLITNFNRAKIAWYIIDPIFYGTTNRPKNINKEDLSLPYVRRVRINEVFPDKELSSGAEATYLSILNLAFYPQERGPYNFDAKPVSAISAGVNQDGSLKLPESRWGGIMRKINNTDFEASNVEYIEFWVMDPFIGKNGQDGNPKHSGGKLYFNLGDVSEDVLRDGRKAFENGMPTTATVVDVDTTQWGRVPKLQAIVNSFDNNPASRKYQDIGLNGLNDEDERAFYKKFLKDMSEVLGGQNSTAYKKIEKDPASDDYVYFRRGLWDTVSSSANKIEDRYKFFNNPQGNSPSSNDNPESAYTTQQTNYPNTEDISGDNTLSEAENYYQYEVNLDPDKMQVGENFITDIRQAQVHLDNGKNTNVKWYQFKIPIRNPQKTVGQIENFQSIRFIRMFMRDFKEPVVLRFASLDLVKSDWRKYQQPLLEDGLHSSAGSEATEFDVAVVGIEENSRRMPIPYVLPPGIKRTTDPASQNNKQLNEQSLSLKVLDLADGDARGVYKNTNYDFRQFKKVEMDVHLEKVKEMDRAEDGDVQLFIRFGADFQDNYYEYEIPLSYTQWGESARDLVWPESNKVEIILDDLVNIKEHRNLLIRSGKSELSYATPYSEQIGKARYTVKGTPAISTVKSILIGIRNPLKHRYNDGDDGAPRSVEVWIDELSLNDFNKKGGVAATARIQASLGDLGNISVAGAYTSANFGTMEQKLTELPKNNTGSYDVSVNLELGKFIPEKAGVKLPVHYDISSVISNPEYNPLDPDIKTKEDLATYSKADKKEVKKQIQDYTLRQNVNFINVRKERTNTEKQPMFWDIENFNLSYSYSSTYHRNEDIEYDNRISHRGGFGYDFSTSPKYFEPLAKTKLADKKIFDILTDFNINYIPNQFSFNMEIFREFTENKLRNKNPEWHLLINPTFYKRFDWTRYYNFHYDLTKSISIGYTANANSFLNEPPGKINTADKKDSVWRSFGQGGSMRNFDQNLNITYTLPINKIPILDWINANASYGSIYRWEAGPLATQERLGNTISNNLNLSATGSVNLVGLYNKVPFLKKINTPSRNNNRRQSKSNEVMATNKEEEKKDTETWKKIYSGALRVLMLVRDASITWSRNQGSALPGFMLEPDLFGNNFNFNAPGAAFSLFGSQRDIRQKAAMEGWLSKDSLLLTPSYNQFTESVTAQATIEPFTDFRITINLGYSKVENQSSYFKYDKHTNNFKTTNPVLNGSYNVTNIMISTAFSKMNNDTYMNKIYQDFLDYRLLIAQRLSEQNPNSYEWPTVYDSISGKMYPRGYKSTSQEVMIPALIAAYTGRDPAKVSLSALSKFPLPNWAITYNGLTKIRGIRKVFKNFSLSHAYSSSYSVGSYSNNLLYNSFDDFVSQMDDNGNFRSEYIMDGIVLSEQFAPLIKLSATFTNDLSINFEYRQSRQIALSFVNNQITEMNSKEWIVGAGYRIKNVGFKVNSGGASKRKITSDIVLKADFSIRNNVRLLRKIDQQVSTPSDGAIVTSINIYAEYEITKQLTARVFYDMTINKPYIATMFYNSTGRGGVSITYKFVE